MRTRASGPAEELVEETCLRASQGWWPRKIDPLTGRVEPSVEMLPPVMQVHRLFCQAGHQVKESSVMASLGQTVCSQCNAGVSLQNGRVETVTTITPGFENVGAVAFEGLTSMNDWIMISLADRTGSGQLRGETPAIGGNIRSGALVLGSNNRAEVLKTS